MIKCTIITGTSFQEVEMKVNRFLTINKVRKIVQAVNLSDSQYVAMAIYYEVEV
jgi:hypothetical protein